MAKYISYDIALTFKAFCDEEETLNGESLQTELCSLCYAWTVATIGSLWLNYCMRPLGKWWPRLRNGACVGDWRKCLVSVPADQLSTTRHA